MSWSVNACMFACEICRGTGANACPHFLSVLYTTTLSSSHFLSPLFRPCSPRPPSYIVLAIGQSTNGFHSSITGGDPSPLGETGWKPSEYRRAFYLVLSLFYSISFMFPLLFSLSLSLPLSPHSLSVSREIAQKAACMQSSPALRRFTYSGLC